MKVVLATVVAGSLSLSASCSGVRVIAQDKKDREIVDSNKFYSEDFKLKMTPIKEQFRQGKLDQARASLLAYPDANLKPVEIATKKNLLGVIYFGKKNFEEAIKVFDTALGLGHEDPNLIAQVTLNLGSAYYKLNQNEKAYAVLSTCDFKLLPENEAKKYHQLHALLAQHLGKKEVSTSSLIRGLSDKKTIAELRADPKFISAEESFNKLSRTERIRLLEDFENEKSLAVAYLGFKETERSYNSGNEEEYRDIFTWVIEHFAGYQEIMDQLQPIKARVQNKDEKINPRVVGVVLPLSGDRSQLGERALSGIDVMLDELNRNAESNQSLKYTLDIKDSQSGAASGAFSVKELIETGKAAIIIGGLNPQSATKEYLEAKKYGVPFISLSQVYLPKEEKNHLLIEIPGSIESQVHHIFNSNLATKLGRAGAILYPKSELGEAYANEFWRKSKQLEYPVTSILSFDRNAVDFKDPIMNLLGIKYPKEREEEMSLVNDISYLERNKNIKRLQNLQPQMDFDWLFVPALPRDVLQLLPNFNFFDAFNTNFVGVPSWRSEIMTNEGYRFGNVYFVDEPLTAEESKFTQAFLSKYKRQPKLVEMLGHDALQLATTIVESQGSIGTREDLDKAMLQVKMLKGESGSWVLTEDVWIKQMTTYRLKREGIELAN